MSIRPGDLLRLDPLDFQRLAVDALAAHLAGSASPRPRIVDLGHGRQDGGFDGVLEDLDGTRARIEAKSAADFANLRTDVREHLAKYDDLPTVILCRRALDESERATLVALRTTPPVRVHDGGEICSWLRAHPWIGRAFGLGGPAWIVPAHLALRDRPEPRMAASEIEAVESALEQLANDPQILVVHGPPGARPNVVIEALAHRLTEADPAGRPVAIIDPAILDTLSHRDVADLGLDREAIRLLAIPPDPRTARWTVREEAIGILLARSGLGLVVPARSGRNLLSAAFGRPTAEVALAVPTAHERRTFAHAASGRQGMEIDAWSIWIEDLDHLDALAQPGALENLVRERASDDSGRELGAWVALLDPVPRDGLARLGEIVEVANPRGVLGRLVDAHLVERTDQAYVPAGKALRAVLIRTWLWDDHFDADRFWEQVRRLDQAELERCLAGLWAAALPHESSDPAARLIEEFIMGSDADARRSLLRASPEAFGASDRTYHEALALATEPQAPLEGIVKAVCWQGARAPDVLALVINAAPGLSERLRKELARLAVDAGNGVPAAAAARAMRWLVGEIAQGLAPEIGVDIALEVLEVRLAATIRHSRSYPTGVTFGTRVWNVGHPAVADAFHAAGDLLVAMVTHSDVRWRDAGYSALRGAARDIGFSTRSADAPLPPALVDALHRAIRVAAAAVPTLQSRPERIRREATLCMTASVARWAHHPEVARTVANAVARDPDSRLLHRLTADMFDFPAPDRLVEDPDGARHEARPSQRYAEDDTAVAEWLATGTPAIDQLRAVLVDATMIAGESSHRAIRGDVLVALAEHRRDLVAPFILEDWGTLSIGTRRFLVPAAICMFRDDIASAVIGAASDEGAGLPACLLRWFAAPLAQAGADAGLLGHVARFTLPIDLAPIWLCRLADHHDPYVRQQVEWWLEDWAERGFPDPAQLADVVRRVVAPPHGLPQLAWISNGTREHAYWALDGRPELERVLLDALETHLPSLDSGQPGEQGKWELQTLVARFLAVRPEKVWARPGAFRPRFDEAKLLERVSSPIALSVLRSAPAVIVDDLDGIAAALFDFLIRHLNPEHWAQEVLALLETGQVELALRWAAPRAGYEESHLDLVVQLLDQAPDASVESLVTGMVRGRWRTRFGLQAWRIDAFEEPPPYEPPAMVVGLRERAEAASPRLSARVRLMADALEEEARAERDAVAHMAWPR